MSVKVNGFDNNPFDQRSIISGFARVITTLCRLALTGNYVTGGDTLDWTNGGVNTAVPPGQSFQTTGPIRTEIGNISVAAGVIGLGGNYVCIPGTAVTNWLLKVFKTAGSEYGATAYLADALTDTILVRADWAR
jgi:hypothetical protein